VTRYLFPCALFAGLGLLAFTTPGKVVASDSDREGQKIAYFGDRGPILIELNIHIDGKPLREVHEALMQKLFDYLDRDGDGVLSKSEAAAAPSPATLSNPLSLLGRRVGGVQQRLRPDRDGNVTRKALAAYYRRSGLPPLQVSDGSNQGNVFRLVGAPQETSADKLTDRLFELLDTDKDGKLSRKELEAAPEILGRMDVDEDEMITSAEIMGQAGGSNGYGGFAFVVDSFGQMGAGSRTIHVVADGRQDEALGRLILQRYGKRGEKFVSASSLGLSKEALATLDPDDTGKLTPAMLARFGTLPPGASFTVHLGNRGDRPMIAVNGDKPLPEGVKAKVTDRGATLQLGSSRLELGEVSASNVRIAINLRDQVKMVFRRADPDNKGYVERKNAGRGNVFADSFDAIDRDGDGKITEKELMAWFDQMDSLRKLVDRSCVSMVVSTEGRGLFEYLDTNRDGKLSIRELRKAAELLERLGARDGKLDREDVPRHHRGGLALGPNGGQDPLGRKAIVFRQGDMRATRPSAARGPLWFQKMDRNRDGDVSRKEFLGTDEQFKAIDTDGDGLISVEEAEAFDKRQPPRPQPRNERRVPVERRR
jgi:Ca2+-binding EF-hand superfamily protein